MNWFRNLFGGALDSSQRGVKSIRDKFSHFLSLLEENNRILKVISDMEEKAQGDFLFDINYIRDSLVKSRKSINKLIADMIALGGEKYLPLTTRLDEIDSEIDLILPGCQPTMRDDLTIPLEDIVRERACSVGSKNAQMGELKSQLGLPVPDGFAVSGWAYRQFLKANDLQNRIGKRIKALDVSSYEQLKSVSEEIQAMVRAATIPPELVEAIESSFKALVKKSGSDRFSLRSSAIGEDTEYSFAGQYATFLNVRRRDVIDRYHEVLASKFTPQAIYYYLSHDLSESQLAMSVGCIVMVNSRASGVVYTRDPVHPNEDCVMVSAIYGLGKYLVDGTLTPDTICVSRKTKTVTETDIAVKPVRLVLKEDGGTVEEAVPEDEQQKLAVSEKELALLLEHALKIEEHYGSPQDIEWAIDHDGRLFFLQTRPLHVIEPTEDVKPDLSGLNLVMAGGDTVCPGAGGGSVFHVETVDDLSEVPDGAVLVAPHTFPGLITVMGKVSAIVTDTGGVACHMATIAREYRIPCLVGMERCSELPQGKIVTVDATAGAIYEGLQDDLIQARKPEFELFSDMAIFNILQDILVKVAPLNLIHPSDANFVPEKCQTFHDIIRLCHQKAMEEMFLGGLNVPGKDQLSVRLKSDIPLKINIIYIDQDYHDYAREGSIDESEIASEPMRHFWNGVKHEGWPAAHKMDVKGFMSVMGTSVTAGGREDFSETSFAILSREYMIISLRMGYHFTTVEAMCADEVRKNYVRMQYKEGGASLDRRSRRIKLIMDILTRLGFEHHSKGDFLDSRLAYREADTLYKRLFLLGRLTMLTKQLDMALSNDSVAGWYTKDIMKKLGLLNDKERRS
ncbi:MAG: hypothetical protein GY867_07380 [bacterium]|nr:hypothetical protein [bacterium]